MAVNSRVAQSLYAASRRIAPFSPLCCRPFNKSSAPTSSSIALTLTLSGLLLHILSSSSGRLLCARASRTPNSGTNKKRTSYVLVSSSLHERRSARSGLSAAAKLCAAASVCCFGQLRVRRLGLLCALNNSEHKHTRKTTFLSIENSADIFNHRQHKAAFNIQLLNCGSYSGTKATIQQIHTIEIPTKQRRHSPNVHISDYSDSARERDLNVFSFECCVPNGEKKNVCADCQWNKSGVLSIFAFVYVYE